MKLATIRLGTTDASTAAGTVAVRIDGDIATEIGSADGTKSAVDVGEVLRTIGLQGAAKASGTTHAVASLDYSPLVLNPGKIICVGLNYRTHILEMKRELPEFPTLFAKFTDTLLADGDPIIVPPESDMVDWEGELAIIIGSHVRRARGAVAEAAIAGYSICNDISMRDWQFRTREWLQGKIWADSTPLGPILATPDEIPADAHITTMVDGVQKQYGDIHDLVHDPVFLVEYISTILPLNPGDVIITGTPGGVGNAREPQEFLSAGQVVSVSIDGIGTLENPVVAGAV
jgi:acylpyruvate hydrolase